MRREGSQMGEGSSGGGKRVGDEWNPDVGSGLQSTWQGDEWGPRGTKADT